MANKKLLYNENGTNAEIANSGSLPSVYFDDTTNTLVAQGLVINKVTASIGSTNGILGTDANGKLTTISTASATSGQYLQSDGTNWAFRNATGVATGDYLPGSDLSGSLSAPTVISIRNVVSGTLSALNGGTDVSTFTSGGIFVKDSTSTMKMLRPDAAASVLRPDGSGSWYSGGSTGTASYNVQVTYLTCSTPYTTYNTTWTKPTGHKNVKVILMGGGGGGGGGANNFPSTNWGASGGGAGGFSVYDFLSQEIASTASVQVGGGGTRGISSLISGTTGSNGGSGGDTYFNLSSDIFVYATGGGGGGGGGSSLIPGGAAGWGNISRGDGDGASRVGGAGAKGGSGLLGSGGGGAGGSQQANGGAGGDTNTLLIMNNFTGSGGSGGTGQVITPANTGSIGTSVSTFFGAISRYAIISGGGGGGGASPGTLGTIGGSGANGVSGSGGGGGGATRNTTGSPITGGFGGDGYAIIISW